MSFFLITAAQSGWFCFVSKWKEAVVGTSDIINPLAEAFLSAGKCALMRHDLRGRHEEHFRRSSAAIKPLDGFMYQKNRLFLNNTRQIHTENPNSPPTHAQIKVLIAPRPVWTSSSSSPHLQPFTPDALHHANIKWNMSRLSSLPQKKHSTLCREHY